MKEETKKEMATFEVKVAEDGEKIEVVLPNGDTEQVQNLLQNPIVTVIATSRQMKGHEKLLAMWSDVLMHRLPLTYSWLAREGDLEAFGNITTALFEVSQKNLEAKAKD